MFKLIVLSDCTILADNDFKWKNFLGPSRNHPLLGKIVEIFQLCSEFNKISQKKASVDCKISVSNCRQLAAI